MTPWTVASQAPLSMGILQARILEWVAIPFSRGPSQLRDQTRSPALQSDFFFLMIWVTGEAPLEKIQRYSSNAVVGQINVVASQVLHAWGVWSGGLQRETTRGSKGSIKEVKRSLQNCSDHSWLTSLGKYYVSGALDGTANNPWKQVLSYPHCQWGNWGSGRTSDELKITTKLVSGRVRIWTKMPCL